MTKGSNIEGVETKPKVGKVYRIHRIHPKCEWYAERHYFENRLMQCVELFESEKAAGFCFIKESDCPDIFHFQHAFSFYLPVLYGQLVEGTEDSVGEACFFIPFFGK